TVTQVHKCGPCIPLSATLRVFVCSDINLLLHSFSFFFYAYPHPRDLHSFPTRRSSDLHTGDIGRVDRDGYFTIVDRLKELIKYRSEEHTSELQSRSDLVCRLLLEKKKKKLKQIKY